MSLIVRAHVSSVKAKHKLIVRIAIDRSDDNTVLVHSTVHTHTTHSHILKDATTALLTERSCNIGEDVLGRTVGDA